MKTKAIGLTDDVVSVYDKTKTTIFGRASVKEIGGKDVIGPPLTKFIDMFVDSGQTPGPAMFLSENNRLFILSAPASGLMIITLYNFNVSTGATNYVGVIRVNLPNTAATTHTIRGFRVIDNGTSGWKLVITSVGSVLINGGTFLVNNIALSDFTPILANTIPFATGNNQKAVYFLQDPAAVGVSHVMTAAAGMSVDFTNSKTYVHNGVAAAHQFYVFDLSIAPTYASQNCTISIATPGVITLAGHPYLANDPVVFTTTGALPTGLVAGTVYFVRNPGANTFEVSATSGGASINTTGTQSGTHSVGRAHGITTGLFSLKTGNLPALVGTLLLTNSENLCTPQHTTNSGQLCVFFCTSSNMYLGQLSELTSLTTTWPSLITANVLGDADDVTAPNPLQAFYSNTVDIAVLLTNTSIFIGKRFVNSQIQFYFGGLSNTWLENVPNFQVTTFSLAAIVALENRAGWLLISGSTTGQRGILAMDMRSDAQFQYSYVISPVITDVEGMLNTVATLEQLFDSTNSVQIECRTSGFDSASGGWTSVSYAQLLETVIPATGIQFKILYDITYLTVNTPAQIHDLLLTYTGRDDISDNWVGSNDNTTSGTPSRTAFRLVNAYPSAVPKMYFRAYDDAGVLVASANTVDNPSSFQYSSNNGTTWNALGTIPNVVGTTELRYNWASPPGVKVTCSLREG